MPRRSPAEKAARGGVAGWAARAHDARRRLTPLAVAWLALAAALLGAAGFFLLALQEGVPRRGGGVSLALPAADAEAPKAAPSGFGVAHSPLRGPGAAGAPRVAVVVTGLGLARRITRRAIDELPADVALSFSPYAKDLGTWLRQARAKGHEVLLDLPMEPLSFPREDPGPKGLMTLLDTDQNLARLDWILGRAEGYVGVVASMGSRFVASPENMKPVLEALKSRGLLFLDNGASEDSVSRRLAESLALPHATSDRSLDGETPSRAAIRAGLEEAERLARAKGLSIALGQPYPATLESIAAWAAALESRGLALSPVSAAAGLPAPRQAGHRETGDE